MGTMLMVFFVFAFNSIQASSDTDDKLTEEYAKTMLECFRKSGLSDDDLAEMQKSNVLDSEKKKCMYACAYKAVGMMNEQGMLDVENLKKITKETYANDPETMQETLKFIEVCKSVNDEPVTDGERGCDRAALMFKCSVEKAPKLSL